MADRPKRGSSLSDAAACLGSRRAEILAACERQVGRTRDWPAADLPDRREVLAQAEEALDEVISALSRGRRASDMGPSGRPGDVGAFDTAAAGVPQPAGTLPAAAGVLSILAAEVADRVGRDGDALAVAMLALNQRRALRTGEAAAQYHGFLRSEVRQAQLAERRHLARELHDRVGADISIAHRQLELHEMSHGQDTDASRQHFELAQRQLVKVMNDIRQLTSGLRHGEPFTGLARNLRNFARSVTPEDIATEVIVNGDEAWLMPDTVGEVFLIVREALRNALQHSRARAVLVRIDVAPHELRATIDDDGVGFEVGALTATGSAGILSMRERVALLGGAITLSSQAGRGTKVEIYIPATRRSSVRGSPMVAGDIPGARSHQELDSGSIRPRLAAGHDARAR